MINETCEKYIKLIKACDNYDKAMLNRLLAKHNFQLNFDTMQDLSKLYDWMDKRNGFDERLGLKLKNSYGITKEYNEKIDAAFNKLEEQLI